MGVRGLTSFIRENRWSLSNTLTLDQETAERHGAVPVVVDAWGIIYQLYLDTLSWTSGGEYLRFFRLVRRLIIAWRNVGLEPTFVFDGKSYSAPPEKHETILSRLHQQLATARLFYTTSPGSRSGPSFSRQTCILPPFALHTFIHALASLDVATHFVPMGEADGICVTLADRLGGYILGQDSDFLILAGGSGVSSRLAGYCPFDMMWWIDGAPEVESHLPNNGTGWQTASSRRGPPQRYSTLFPPAQFIKPQLILTSFAPQALRQRLRLPSSILPLFASLAGNDYTPSSASEYLFETGLSPVQKIEKVARILREQIFSPRSTPPRSGNVGDQAVELVKKVIRKLSIRPFVNDQALQDLVDAVIEATFQYDLPPSAECCSTYPFCGELDIGCQTDSPIAKLSAAKEAYATARMRGLLNGITHAWLYPGRVYLWSVLEDPSGPSLKSSPGLTALRRTAWEIADEGFGGLRWPESGEDGAETSSTPADVSDETIVSTETSSEGETLVNGEAQDPKVEQSPGIVPSRTITEYVRQGSSARIVAHPVELSSREEQDIPTCLQPLETRLRGYLNPLQSDTPAIFALPPHLHPLIATIRFCVLSARTDRWRLGDVEVALKAGLGSFAAWQKESCSSKIRRETDESSYPLLNNRHCGLVAQLTATMTDAHLLAQSLLLLPNPPNQSTETPGLTHLIPFVFFSGVILHSLFSGDEPQSSSIWRWTALEQELYGTCFPAMTEGIEEFIVGWLKTPPRQVAPVAKMASALEMVGTDGDDTVEKEKRKKKRSHKGKGGKGPDSGRFELLNGLAA